MHALREQTWVNCPTMHQIIFAIIQQILDGTHRIFAHILEIKTSQNKLLIGRVCGIVGSYRCASNVLSYVDNKTQYNRKNKHADITCSNK